MIPLFLTLEGRDPRTMDLLAIPSAISVSLRRRVRFFNKTCTSREDVAWNENVNDVVTAVWWPSTTQEVRPDATTRFLGGEIRLPKDLRPTSEMGHFSISVSPVPNRRFGPAFSRSTFQSWPNIGLFGYS